MSEHPHIHTNVHQNLIAVAVEGMEGAYTFAQFLFDIHDQPHFTPEAHNVQLVAHLFRVLAEGGDPKGTIADQVASILEGYEIRPYEDLPGILARNAEAFDPDGPEYGRVAYFLTSLGDRARDAAEEYRRAREADEI